MGPTVIVETNREKELSGDWAKFVLSHGEKKQQQQKQNKKPIGSQQYNGNWTLSVRNP